MDKAPIGWIGTGVMGRSMAGHLLAHGYSLHVFNRTKDRTADLIAQGAQWHDSPAEVARHSTVVFTIVGFPADVEEVYFGESGILKALSGGEILVDMTTTAPSLAMRIYTAARTVEAQAVDAPVSGGDVGARNATLSIMAGGDDQVIAQIRPLLDLMGKNIVHTGGPGSGQHTKMCNQITIAGTMVGVCESLLYGYRAGLDLNTMLQAISGGAAGCWTLNNLAPRIVQGNFDPGFYVEHFVKDMEIALAEARAMKLAMPGLALVHQLYKAVEAQGHGRKGTHALYLALEAISSAKI